MLKNKRGFTLIELLAVIVIIGVLMTIGTIAVTKYISTSKKDVYALTMKNYINVARESITNGEYKVQMWNYPATKNEVNQLKCTLPPTQQITIIPLSKINVETNLSPYKKTIDKGYIVIANENQNLSDTNNNSNLYKYYFVGVDTEGNGVITLTEEANLTKKIIRTKIRASEYQTASTSDLGRLLRSYNNITVTNDITVKTSVDTTTTFLNGYKLYQICM
ncbi:MAG: type II secretion system protein [Bacilli bacterium]|nr:type II secretion system protein [Bacilli bacterium]